MLWEFKNNKKKFLVFMTEVSLLTTKSKTDFQSFCSGHWEMNLNKEAQQILIKIL